MKLTLMTSLLLLTGAGFFLLNNNPVIIESLESKTREGQAVFNEINLLAESSVDVWKMKQSHDGINHPKGDWDELQIIVDKSSSPQVVSYHQLKNGKEIEFKASCFLCHANGPRAIRPDTNSKTVSLSVADKVKILSWNLRIKTYGRMVIKDSRKRKISLALNRPGDYDELPIATCMKCHADAGFLSRGKLKRQHAMTIKHLVKTGAMPPWPYSLSNIEKRNLDKFLEDTL